MRCSFFLFFLCVSIFSLGQSPAKQETPAQSSLKQDQGKPDRSPQIPPWTDAFWSNWALVVITGVAVWAALQTLDDLKEQTAIAKKSADAALLNAQAIINSERPWVTFFAIGSENDVYSFRAGNVGRSPAKILSFAYSIIYAHPSKLSGDPSYGVEHIPKLDFLMPGHELGDQDMEICAVEPRFLMFQDSDLRDRLNDRVVAVIVLLRILYEDSVNPDPSTKLHETRMCFDWTPGMNFKIGGPISYNRHT